MRSGAKKAVVWTCGLGVLVIVGATAKSWGALTERYWLSKLETSDGVIALEAARELSRRQSVRAVRPLVARIRATSTEDAKGWSRSRPRGLVRPQLVIYVDDFTDVYLPPFALCLHGVGSEAMATLEREISKLEREASGPSPGKAHPHLKTTRLRQGDERRAGRAHQRQTARPASAGEQPVPPVGADHGQATRTPSLRASQGVALGLEALEGPALEVGDHPDLGGGRLLGGRSQLQLVATIGGDHARIGHVAAEGSHPVGPLAPLHDPIASS